MAAQVGLFVEEAEAGDKSKLHKVCTCVTGPILLGRLPVAVAKFCTNASSDGNLWKANAARAFLSGSQLLWQVLYWQEMDCCHCFRILVFSHAMSCIVLTCTVRPWVLRSGAQGATHVDEERYVVRPLQ